MRTVRTLLAALAGAIAWFAGLNLVFGPAQALLADPARQSPKFLAAFSQEPLPRMADTPWVLPAGLLVVALSFAIVYAWLEPRLPGRAWRKGLTFGLIAWALMVPWFELYLPWNVMHEPFPLVLLEAGCWLILLLLVGVSIALAQGSRGAAPRAG